MKGIGGITAVRHWIDQQQFTLVESQYAMTVRLTIQLPATAVDAARITLTDLHVAVWLITTSG